MTKATDLKYGTQMHIDNFSKTKTKSPQMGRGLDYVSFTLFDHKFILCHLFAKNFAHINSGDMWLELFDECILPCSLTVTPYVCIWN